MNDRVFENAIGTFGQTHQTIIAIEELSELAKELTKMLRGIGSHEHLVEEVADVYIVLGQIRLMYGVTYEEIGEAESYKIARLERTIDEQKRIRTDL